MAEVAAKVVPKMREYFAALERCQTDAREELLEVRRRQVAGGLLAQPELFTAFGRKAMFAFDGACWQLETEVEYATLINKMGEIAPGDNAILNAVDKLTPLAEWGPVLTQVGAEVHHAENVLGAAQPGGGEDNRWSKPNGPTQWAKKFGFSVDTLQRRFEDGSIRHKRLSSKSYSIHMDDLPK